MFYGPAGYLHGNGNPALEVAAKFLNLQSEADMMKTVAQLNVLNTLKHMNIVGIIGILEWSKHSKGGILVFVCSF